MVPSWIRSNPLMQRSSVLLPAPEGPISTTTSPRWTTRSTPSRTTVSPNLLTMPRISTSGSFSCPLCFSAASCVVMASPPVRTESVLETVHQEGEHEHDGQVVQRDDEVHGQRLVGRGSEVLRGAEQLGHADERHQRGVLHLSLIHISEPTRRTPISS